MKDKKIFGGVNNEGLILSIFFIGLIIILSIVVLNAFNTEVQVEVDGIELVDLTTGLLPGEEVACWDDDFSPRKCPVPSSITVKINGFTQTTFNNFFD